LVTALEQHDTTKKTTRHSMAHAKIASLNGDLLALEVCDSSREVEKKQNIKFQADILEEKRSWLFIWLIVARVFIFLFRTQKKSAMNTFV
jgi:hypothetical protein